MFARFWPLVATLVTGFLAFAFLPEKAFKEVTQELIALFGLMMAGVLPTMVLTASVLRAGNLSVKTIREYRDALRGQLVIWIGLFLISLIASLLVILGKMAEWSFVLTLSNWSIDIIRTINALIAAALALVVFRAVAVGNGIISLLRLSAELAVSEAQARDAANNRSAESSIANMVERESYGAYVNLKH